MELVQPVPQGQNYSCQRMSFTKSLKSLRVVAVRSLEA